MNIRKKIAAAAGTGVMAIGGLALLAPSAQAVSAEIVLTSGGSLTISEPTGPVALGSTGTTIGAWTSGAYGTVTVTDTRTGLISVGGLSPNAWTATATIGDFTRSAAVTGATAAQTTIFATGMVYNTANPVTATSSTTGSTFTAVGGAVAGAGTPVVAGTMASTGPNSQTWSPTLQVTLANQVAGTYNGTITHSVS